MSDWARIYAYEKHASVVKYPATSFLIAGVSFYKSITENLKVDDILTMSFDPENVYDDTAIVIKYMGETCGHVPLTMKDKITQFVPCQVKIIDKRFGKNDNFGIRVDVVPGEF